MLTFRRRTNALQVASKRTKMEEAVRKQNILVSKFRLAIIYKICSVTYVQGHSERTQHYPKFFCLLPILLRRKNTVIFLEAVLLVVAKSEMSYAHQNGKNVQYGRTCVFGSQVFTDRIVCRACYKKQLLITKWMKKSFKLACYIQVPKSETEEVF